jgi:hypothetical protein
MSDGPGLFPPPLFFLGRAGGLGPGAVVGAKHACAVVPSDG